MATYTVKSHPVEVARITGLQPLVGPNTAVLSPDFGLLLILENGQKHKWLSEKNAPIPAAGDWFVKDAELNTVYVVSAVKFSTLFDESKG